VNQLHGNRIISGRSLFIPIPVSAGVPADLTSPIQTAERSSSAPKQLPKGKKIVYRVKAGDTVWGLSRLFNVTIKQICRWNGFRSTNDLKAGKKIVIYSGVEDDTRTRDSDNNNGYMVKSGDTVASIARHLGVGIEELLEANGLTKDNSVIHPGDHLRLPDKVSRLSGRNPGGPVKYVVAAGDNLYSIAETFSVGVSDLMSVNNLGPSSVIRPGDILLIPSKQSAGSGTGVFETDSYIVKKGDTLWGIASRFGMQVDELRTLNNMSGTVTLKPGDRIRVRGK
jgi:LysM repeat protein